MDIIKKIHKDKKKSVKMRKTRINKIIKMKKNLKRMLKYRVINRKKYNQRR
jgi:hypothetical protein